MSSFNQFSKFIRFNKDVIYVCMGALTGTWAGTAYLVNVQKESAIQKAVAATEFQWNKTLWGTAISKNSILVTFTSLAKDETES